MFDFTRFYIVSDNAKAEEILADELKKRGFSACADGKKLELITDSGIDRDSYKIELNADGLCFFASGIRGFVYAIGRFLRKTEYRNGSITLTDDISGEYSPYMQIRGHQLGYRDNANTYEAWDIVKYYDYIKELMYFGCNVFEHTVFHEKDLKKPHMKYSQLDFVTLCNEKAKTLDIDISYWCPNDKEKSYDSLRERADFFANQKYADIYFPPSSDPGDFTVDEAFDMIIPMARELKKSHPEIKIYPSAQSPDGFGKWGDDFIEKMSDLPEEIDGIITGPNCAMPLHELRKRLPKKYPIRLYPDITHNVRCEYPVHFDRDDWHYALASTLSREAINPRPCEYRTIHRLTRQYIIGSVSYSEGINDDINKFVWSDMDFDPNVSLEESLADYARLFFFGADTQKLVNGIFGLEKNWEGDPAENPHIETTLKFFEDALTENPGLYGNVRFLMCLFRAKCDMLVKMRRCTELELIKKAKYHLAKNEIDIAEKILNTPFTDEYNSLRDGISEIGKLLFEKAGMQLDVEHYFASGVERGATLDTIDMPVTDRKWLLDRIEYSKTLVGNEKAEFINAVLDRNKIRKGEYYFSFAENSFTELGIPQEPYFYMNFQGDRVEVNNGTIPMSMLKVFDHYSFRMKTGGLDEGDYNLILNIKPRYDDSVNEFTIKINGKVLYSGAQYGGERDEKAEKWLSAPGFEVRKYKIPASYIENGCIELEITEPKIGIMLSEIFIRK
ncbi:MAG: hypothetical protein IJZ35_06660 [Clostridia bacterium]|nr:hypothetical protein [Clostridia bacterium]